MGFELASLKDYLSLKFLIQLMKINNNNKILFLVFILTIKIFKFLISIHIQ